MFLCLRLCLFEPTFFIFITWIHCTTTQMWGSLQFALNCFEICKNHNNNNNTATDTMQIYTLNWKNVSNIFCICELVPWKLKVKSTENIEDKRSTYWKIKSIALAPLTIRSKWIYIFQNGFPYLIHIIILLWCWCLSFTAAVAAASLHARLL